MKLTNILAVTLISLSTLTYAASEKEVKVPRKMTVLDFYPSQRQVPAARWKAVLRDNTTGKVIRTGILCKWFRAVPVENGTIITVPYNPKTNEYDVSCGHFVK